MQEVAQRDPISFLTERLASTEAERDQLADRATRLEALQRSFGEITAATTEAELATGALRGAFFALGFSRAMWFTVDEIAYVTASYEIDGDEVVESQYGDVFPEGSALLRIAHGESDAATGYADDADAPLFETRRWYAAAAVRVRSGAGAVLYADGAAERTISTWAVSALQELANQAALAVDNMRMAQELERLAMRDPLTGLLNRRALMDRFAMELATARRTGEPLGFAMIDVDDFKKINDTEGHAGGDAALETLAGIFSSRTRETDVPARFAGDEFSLIMPRTDRDTASVVLERIYDALRHSGLSCSVGVAFYPHDGFEEHSIVAAADAAVYAAKAAGKNCYRFATGPTKAAT